MISLINHTHIYKLLFISSRKNNYRLIINIFYFNDHGNHLSAMCYIVQHNILRFIKIIILSFDYNNYVVKWIVRCLNIVECRIKNKNKRLDFIFFNFKLYYYNIILWIVDFCPLFLFFLKEWISVPDNNVMKILFILIPAQRVVTNPSSPILAFLNPSTDHS